MRQYIVFCSLGIAMQSQAEVLELTINNVATDKGQVYLQVFNSDDTWMTDNFVLRAAFPAAELQKSQTVKLELEYGEYGISVFHDVDDDGELDTNWIGIPKEPVGMSNDAKGSMGPAKYQDAKFLFNPDTSSHVLSLYDI